MQSFGKGIVDALLVRGQGMQAHVRHVRSETRSVRDEKDRVIEVAARRREEIGVEAQWG